MRRNRIDDSGLSLDEFNRRYLLAPEDQIAALLDAKREQNEDAWYERPEWERRKVLEAQKEGFGPTSQLEAQAERAFGSGEDDVLAGAWQQRPDAERKKVLERYGTLTSPGELERRALSLFPE